MRIQDCNVLRTTTGTVWPLNEHYCNHWNVRYIVCDEICKMMWQHYAKATGFLSPVALTDSPANSNHNFPRIFSLINSQRIRPPSEIRNYQNQQMTDENRKLIKNVNCVCMCFFLFYAFVMHQANCTSCAIGILNGVFRNYLLIVWLTWHQMPCEMWKK